VPGTERRDEIGSLARALGRLGISIRGAMERLEGR
jgi:HAMP domain-containing protein